MKYFLGTITLLALLVSHVPIVHAISMCGTVDSTNYQSCCVDDTTDYVDECNTYITSQSTSTTPTTTTPAATTNPSLCSPSNVTNDACYEHYCTGQSNEDSQSCNSYATSYTQTNNPDNPQCYSIGPNNESQCCPVGSMSPICIAYNDYTNNDAQAESQANGSGAAAVVGGQIGSAINGANISTAAINAGSAIGNGISAAGVGAASNSCSAVTFKTILDIATWVKCIIGTIIIPGIFLLAFVVFLWGILKFMRATEEKDKKESKNFIFVGLIGLFVMVGVWGILKILGTTFGIDTTIVPTLQTSAPTAATPTSNTAPTSITPITTN
jgi:hypothetical protein